MAKKQSREFTRGPRLLRDASPPPGYKKLHTGDLSDTEIRDIRKGDNPVSDVWALLRIGIRRIEGIPDGTIYRDRAELQFLFNLMNELHIGIAVSIEGEEV